jgi:hypothetical protein
MMPSPSVLFASVMLLLPMSYFFLQSPTFLLMKLDNPSVTFVMRGMFSIYFVLLAVAGVIGTSTFVADGRPGLAAGVGAILVFAIAGRRWFLRRIDAGVAARDAGDPDAVRRLRRLHWSGMACNAVQLAVVVTGIPFISAP